MLTYGAAAQNYFNYNTGALANAGVKNIYADITMPTDVPAVSVTDNLEKVTYIGSSLVFRSQVYTRFYFKMDDRNTEINNYTVTINGQDCLYGKFYDPQGRFNYFADSPGITPNNYDQQQKVVITNTVDNTTLTVSYSPLNYIVNKSSSSTANLPELMKAMYGYHVESCEYMNYENAVGITFKYKDTDGNTDNQGYGTNGIEYENSVVNKIFAVAPANSMPIEKDYYPQSADCIKLVRRINGEKTTISVADVTKPAIQKRSEEVYHIYAQNLTVELQDQDVLIVEGNFSDDRDDIYKDCETVKIATAYVYVDRSYENAATITSAEPVFWQTINVGPFYNHFNSNSDYHYMAADANAVPFFDEEDKKWAFPFMATAEASLTYVHDGISENMNVTGLLIKKYDNNDYYIEGGDFEKITLKDGEYIVLKGAFRNNALKIDMNVAETYIMKDSYNGKIYIDKALTMWQIIDVGPFYNHANTNLYDGNNPMPYRYMAADANAVPFFDEPDKKWDFPFMATAEASLTYVHDGISENMVINGMSIKKFAEKEYYIENGPYSNELKNGEYFILEGLFEQSRLKVAVNVFKTYIYKDSHSGEVTISGTLPSDIPCIEWLAAGQNDEWIGGRSMTIDGVTHYNDGVYASYPTTNITHGGGTWGCEYRSTSVDNIKIVRNGVTSSIAIVDGQAFDIYDENYLFVNCHTRWSVEYTDASGNPSPLQAGDILIVEGLFKHKTTGEKVWIEKTYITLFADGTTAFTTEMPVSHTVILNADDGTGSTTSLSTTTGGKVTLPTPTRDGYRFNGWYTAASGGTKVGDANASYYPTGNVKLYAQWTQLYKITVSENGGTFKRTDGGSLTNIAAGDTVTGQITYEHKDNRSFTVKNANGNNVYYTSNNDGTITFTMPASDVTITVKSECIAEGTMITLADGSQKKVEDLTTEDRLLSFNHETGEYIETAILFIENDGSNWYNVINLEFANGATTRLIYEHALFDLDLSKYVYITEQNFADYVGHLFAQQDGTATELLNAYITNEYVGCYSLVTEYHLNYFIEGMFSIPGGIEGLFNIFEYDENMVYDAQKMADDIETYGLFTYEDFADYGVSEEMFNAFPTKYLKVSIGKGYITMERIEYLIQRYGVYFQ